MSFFFKSIQGWVLIYRFCNILNLFCCCWMAMSLFSLWFREFAFLLRVWFLFGVSGFLLLKYLQLLLTVLLLSDVFKVILPFNSLALLDISKPPPCLSFCLENLDYRFPRIMAWFILGECCQALIISKSGSLNISCSPLSPVSSKMGGV